MNILGEVPKETLKGLENPKDIIDFLEKQPLEISETCHLSPKKSM
jgi:hypothetical protein